MSGNELSSAQADRAFKHCEELFLLAYSGSGTLINAVVGLRSILQATALINPSAVPRETAMRTAQVMAAAIPVVAEAAERSVPAENVYLSMAAACNLVQMFGRSADDLLQSYSAPLVQDWLDYTALLADELDALHRRQQIQARGDVLLRSISIRRAASQSADGAPLH